MSLIRADWLGITKSYEEAEVPEYCVPAACFLFCLFKGKSFQSS